MKKDLSASVRQKLANVAKVNGMFFQEILQRHAMTGSGAPLVDGQPKAGGEVIKPLNGDKACCSLP